MNYVYKISMTGTSVFYKRLEDAVVYMKAIAKSERLELHIVIERVDDRCVLWDQLSYSVHSEHAYDMGKWISAGCPTELSEEKPEADVQ